MHSTARTPRILLGFAAALMLLSGVSTDAEAQRSRSRMSNSSWWPTATGTLQVGAFWHDAYGDGASPMIALRNNWRVRNWLVTELGWFYTRPELSPDEDANMTGVDLAVQAEAPFSIVRPYIGLGMGIHGTFEPSGGDRYFGPSTQAMAGARAMLPANLGLRGEVRYRLDEQQGGFSADNMELTIGLSWPW